MRLGSFWTVRERARTGERVVATYAANRFQGWRTVGGQIVVTDRRLVFLPCFLDAWTGGERLSVDLDQVASFRVSERRRASFLSIPRRRLVMDLKDGGVEEFVIYRADERATRLNTVVLAPSLDPGRGREAARTSARTMIETRNAALRAFPRSLRPLVEDALALMPPPIRDLSPSGAIGPLLVGDEQVVLPYRIYSPEPPASRSAMLGREAAIVSACLYTRHHDGHVRERAAARIVSVDQPWVVPFVVQLLGEYVVEIAEAILQRIDEVPRDAYRRFAEDNPGYLATTRKRVVSYWDCYYRPRWGLAEHPPFQVMKRLDLWAGIEGKRPLRERTRPPGG